MRRAARLRSSSSWAWASSEAASSTRHRTSTWCSSSPEAGTSDGGKPLANQEFFERLGRRVIATLDEATADGFVFRVDMRLRPYGDPAPFARRSWRWKRTLITQGRTWERYAWLKARPLTGRPGDALERLIEPFVFRKYLDYDAYGGLRDVHRQIRGQASARTTRPTSSSDPAAYARSNSSSRPCNWYEAGASRRCAPRGTLPALAALAARGLLPSAAVAELGDAYAFLRNLEHRLQYRDDAQTHELPGRCANRGPRWRAPAVIANATAFAAALGRHRDTVDRHFDALFGDADDER